MAKHRSARQWASILRRYENSGMTQAAFCKRHGIALSTLCYHLRRGPTLPDGEGEPEPAPGLVELKLPKGGPISPAGAPDAGVRIEWAGSGAVKVTIECHSQQVGQILAQIPNLLPPAS